MGNVVSEVDDSTRPKGEIFAKCALMQTWPAATLRASSLRASGSVPMTGNNHTTSPFIVASALIGHRGQVKAEMRITANHSQDLETSLSTCTEPCLQGSIATLENQLLGRLPQTKPNPRRIGCADRFPALSGQTAVRLNTAKERPSMRCAGGVPWRSIG
jgi:hypothetical protein